MTIAKLENAIKIVTLTRWLVIIIILAIVFWQPISMIVTELPKMVEKSESITLGGMSMKLRSQMVEKPTATFNEAVYGLTPNALLTVADFKGSSDNPNKAYCDETIYLETIQQLEDRGLVRLLDDSTSLSRLKTMKMYTYSPTPLGIKSGKIMRDLIKVFINQLTGPKDFVRD